MPDVKFSGRLKVTIEGKSAKGMNFLEDNMTELLHLTDGRVLLVVHNEYSKELEVYFRENGLEVEIE